MPWMAWGNAMEQTMVRGNPELQGFYVGRTQFKLENSPLKQQTAELAFQLAAFRSTESAFLDQFDADTIEIILHNHRPYR